MQSNISQSLFAGLKQGDDRLSVFLPGFGLVEECPAHPGARIFKRAADILLPMSKPPIVNNYWLTSGGIGHGVLGICRTYLLKENTKLFEQKTASRF